MTAAPAKGNPVVKVGIAKEVNGAEMLRLQTLSQSQWHIAWHKLRHDVTAMLGLLGIILLIAVSILAPYIAPYDPTQMDSDNLLQAPSGSHICGTDDLGRDVLSRVLYGGRESLRVGIVAIFIALSGGTIFGLISGFYGGVLDTVTQRLVEVFMAYPDILLLLSIVAALGPSLSTVLIALGFSSIPVYTRLVRGSVLGEASKEYVLAARVIGVSNSKIMSRHIFPNIMAPIIVYSTLGIGSAINMTAGLSYIGLGAQPPSPEWGAMLNYGRSYLRDAWWMSVWPGLAIFIAVLCINLLGDGLRDALDPKLRQR